jgi:hypothetical protein
MLRITSNSTLKSEAKVETEDEEEYTFEYRCPASNSISEINSAYGPSVSMTRCEIHTTSSNCSRGVNINIREK